MRLRRAIAHGIPILITICTTVVFAADLTLEDATKEAAKAAAAGDWKTALALYSLIIKETGLPTAYLDRCRVLIELNQIPQALSDINEFIKLSPTPFSMAYQRRAYCYAMLGKYENALIDYSTAIKLEPGLANHYLDRAQCYTRLGRPDLAKKDMESAAALGGQKQSPAIFTTNIQIATSKSEVNRKVFQMQQKTFEVMQKGNRDEEKTTEVLKKVNSYSAILAKQPKSYEVLMGRASALEFLHEFTKALQDYTSLIDVENQTPHSVPIGLLEQASYSRASLLLRIGRCAESLTQYEQILQRDPTSEDALRGIGDCHLRIGNYQKAIESYTASIDKSSEPAGSTFYARAKAFAALGQTDLSAQDLKKAKELGFVAK